MNTTGGLSSTQGNGFWFMGSWIPSTPEKLIPSSSNSPTEVRNEYQFGREDWQNLTGTSNVYSQVIPNNNTGAHHSSMLGSIDRSGGNYGDLTETDHMVNNIEGSGFQALLQGEGLGWNDELDEYFTENTDFVSSANRPIFPSLYSQGNSNFKDIDNILINQNHQYYTSQPRNLDSLLVKSNVVPQFDRNRGHSLTKTMLLPRENHSSESFSSSHSSNLPYQYEFFNHCQPSHNRPLEQILQANTMSRNPNTVHVAPIVSPSAKLGKQGLELLDFPVGERSSQEKEKGEIFMTIMQEVTQQQCDGLLQNIVDSSSATISTLYAETHNSDKGCDQGIYFKGTPQQKTPKRRKHRPKVITEGKPKRTPKPRATNQSTENTSGKRKYVRKKALDESATPSADVKLSEYSNTEPAVKSCKRVLNFDRENTGSNSDSQRKQLDQASQVRYKDLDYILETQTSEFCVRGNGGRGKSSTVQTGQRDNLLVENMLSGLLSNPNMRSDYNSKAEIKTAENQLPTSIEHDLDDSRTRLIFEKQDLDLCQNRSQTGNKYMQKNFYGRILEKGNSNLWQNGSIPGNSYTQQNLHVESMWQFVNQTKACDVQKKPTGINLHNPNILPKPFETRVRKRDYPCSIVHADTCPRNVPRSQLPYQEMLHADEYQNGCNLCRSLNIHKKKKLENIRCENNEYSSHKVKSIGAMCLELGEFSSENKQAKVNTGPANHRNVRQMPLEQNFPKQQSDLLLLAERTGKTSGLAKSLPSLTIIEKHNLLPTPSIKKSPIQVAEQAHVSWKLTTLKRKQNSRLISSQSESSVTEKNQSNDFNNGYEHLTDTLADDITWQMKSLDLNDKPNKGGGQEQAIVPYNGSGAIVPSIRSDFIRKRKPRPKVDLDPDTERVWRLLMGKEGSEGLETNKEKEKWWEEEREVFRGRADSFIAKMHLVQGDRRFSRWKGSVVDSVVGVFLTQNVSDHLSSSAFMSLASRYPLKSKTNNRTSNEDAISIFIYEPDIRPLISDDTSQWRKQVLDEESFSKSQISIKHQKDSPTSEVAKLSMEGERQNVEEEVISSQDSESSVTQYLGGIRSCSGSNSEAEDCPTGYTSIKNYHLDSTNSQMVSQPTFFPEFYGHINKSTTLDEVSMNGNLQVVDTIEGSPRSGIDKVENIHGRPDLNTSPTNDDSQPSQAPVAPTNKHILHVTSHSEILEVDGWESFSEESTYSWPSTVSEFTMAKDLTCLSFGELGKLIGRNKEKQNGPPCPQGTPCISIQSISERTAQTSPFRTQPEFFKAQPSPGHQLQKSHNIQSESTSFVEVSKASTDKQTCYGQSVHVPEHAEKVNKLGDIMPKAKNQPQSANGSFGPNSNEQIRSSLKNYERDAKISNINRKKVGKEKNTTVDWDNLRKQVMPDGMKKERSKDAMDSLDYEAIRLANVHEIANTIKERGMNNLLAERIKEFLNRVVEDHGSIDLEWLRDVPPDKAKDYLLSIRGIGLKSVECVRLLTLHHLAFPVDTNVGRIAVRLGWVPLQPLPESLQLHLLELYPMLETIQKFLWPRLCKLDQRTLYELHYQLITFGKVFCTKNKPNCNACPMRGECRHFASAFASARLALPGPVELDIVSSANPISVATPPPVDITPMPLLIETGAESRKCEPIIEVPLTPEQESTEICASDIEDSFFEDPDEIPTIKFNVEELKMNIKDYIPEGDMSKALVALNAAAASIPTQKLKYVSRLRTEHQVYELPDSHPLLEGMDKREPDDPSPYLLAIWKPGETANSFQQEEKDCKSQDPDKLCNEETCFTCSSIKEANSQTVRGTLLVPCRTAMRGSFPLNGTYFQVNEMFADDESSRNPIVVPRVWIWNLPRRTVYFGTSVTTIFKGLSTEGIQYCFWRGFVCVRAFDKKTRAPRPLTERLHHSASKLAKAENEKKQ